MRSIEVLALTRYGALGASSRVRLLQYVPLLAARGIDVAAAPFFGDGYVRRLYSGRPLGGEIAAAYARRLARLLQLRRFEVLWIEKELLPFAPLAVEAAAIGETPYVVDYDDAVYRTYEGHARSFVRRCLGGKIAGLMRTAAAVVAGSPALSTYAMAAGARRVELVPSVVDADRYPRHTHSEGSAVVGWIGSPATEHYLELVATPLARARRELGVRVVLIGASPACLPDVTDERLPWSAQTEASDVARLDIGLMPLRDGAWEAGKCGYKLVQYMATGAAVIASPVGVNRELVRHGENGLLASTEEEWLAAIRRLAERPGERAAMGESGRRLVETEYSLSGNVDRIAGILRDAGGVGR